MVQRLYIVRCIMHNLDPTHVTDDCRTHQHTVNLLLTIITIYGILYGMRITFLGQVFER